LSSSSIEENSLLTEVLEKKNFMLQMKREGVLNDDCVRMV